MTTAVNGLRTTVEQCFQGDPEDDASVHGDHEPPFGANANGRGLGGANGRQPPPIHRAQCVVPPEEDGLGKPKFSIPRFEGSMDVEEYLTWELKIENYGVCMIILKIKRLNLLLLNFMVMHCVGGMVL